MSEAGSPEEKRPRRSLSLSKNRKKNANKNNYTENKGVPAVPSSSSILSFFSNTPPTKFTCPICGLVVSRYEINKHIDEMCPKNQGNNGETLVDSPCSSSASDTNSSPYFAKNTSTPEQKTSPCESNSLEMKETVEQKTSPYFKKSSDSACNVHNEARVQTVKMISLGKLSSKLSRRHRIQEGKLTVQSEGNSLLQAVHEVCDNSAELGSEKTCFGDGSQKENQFVLMGPGDLHILKDSLTKEPEIQGETHLCGKEISRDGLVASAQVLALSGSINTRDLTFVAGNTKENSCSEGMVSSHDKPALHSVSQGELCNGSEAEMQSFTKTVPSSGTQVICDNHTQNCPEKGDMTVLPMEVHEGMRNEMFYTALSEPLEEVDFQGPSSGILDKISGLSSTSDSSDHPYYLQNFLMVLRAVLENDDDLRLFDERDTKIITAFYQLSAAGQKLYVRLFQRKLNWIKINKIEYAEISTDLRPVIEELVEGGFLQTESTLEDLSEGLDLLSAPELKTLAKTFHLPNPNAQKQQLLEDFDRLAKQRSIFSRSQAGIGVVILKRAKNLAGKCVKVCRGPRAVFSRILLLFSLTDSMDDEEAASGGQGQLSTVLMANMGHTVFPSYTVNRKTAIFQDREDLIRYTTAAHMSNNIATAMANGNWTEANHLYMCAKETWHGMKNLTSLRYHKVLPEYLRHFTVGWVYTRILSRGVEILQRLHMYEEAVKELQNLLSQEVYCTDSRGRWWDRLALNLHQHLKETKKAIECIRKGLADSFVRTGHRLSLYQRALRIRDSSSNKKFRSLFQELPVMIVEDVTHVTIKGKMYPQTGLGKSVFLMEDVDDEEKGEDSAVSTVICSVEELALTHYKQNGFDQGIHGEGSTFSTLYGLLMWDIIFMGGIPDVFRNSYQAFPLDLCTDSFYENRRDAIEARLQLLHAASSETLKELLADVWSAQEGKVSALVSWNRFTSLQQAQSLVSCLGGPFLSGMCRRLARDLRHCRGGLPDLVVWSTHDHCFKLVEVKGPNDRLSHKQMLWLSELKQLGAAVEVCHVAAVGAKSKCLS
ncbi:PREDICTED: fanconi-associated nuclease 1 isoform X2 [Gavialis gangeticus]|nr:PREDICTED: fanconi-associated nuclease 1 isoform X2 [Gavialis gangeticus]